MTSELETLNAKIDANPADPWLYRERGWLFSANREWKPAIADFTKAIALRRGEPEFWRSRGRLHAHLGHITLSLEDLNEAVALDPNDAKSYDIRGWCHKGFHDCDSALADFDRAIDLEPLEPKYRCRRGLVWLEARELTKALADFDEAIRLNPREASYYYERACALLYENPEVRPETALPDVEEAIRLNPDADWYRMSRGFIRFCQGRWAEAAEDFACVNIRRRCESFPYLGAKDVVWLYLARLFQGQPQSGLKAIEDYMDWYLNESAGHGREKTPAEKLEAWPVPLARLLKGDIDEQQLFESDNLDMIRSGLIFEEDVNKRIMESHFVLAELSLARGRVDEAASHLKKASGLPPRTPMNWVIARQLSCHA